MSEQDTPRGSVTDDSAASNLEELVEDTLAIRRQLRQLEQGQQEAMAVLDRVEEALRESGARHAREIDAIRRDLLSQQRHLAAASVFHSVVPWIDALRSFRGGLRPTRDEKLRKYLDAAIDAMRMMVQSLGFAEFHVECGETFDPSRMECTDYVKGPRGVVLGESRPGYLTESGVVRRAGVLLADPTKPKRSRKGDQQ